MALNFTGVFTERRAAFFPFTDDVTIFFAAAFGFAFAWKVFFTVFTLVAMESPYGFINLATLII